MKKKRRNKITKKKKEKMNAQFLSITESDLI